MALNQYPMIRPQGLLTPSNQNMIPSGLLGRGIPQPRMRPQNLATPSNQNRMPAPRLMTAPRSSQQVNQNNFGFGADFNDPRTQGILGASMGLLNAGGWSKMPTTLGQGLAQGLSSGMGAYNSAMANAPKNTGKVIQGGKFIATTAPDGTVSITKSAIHDQLVAKENADNLMKNRWQVVGGSLIDMKDPNNPNVFYDGNKNKFKTTYSADGKYKFTTSPDGTSTGEKSSLFNDIVAEETKKKKEVKESKVLSNTLAKLEEEDTFAIQTFGNINTDLDRYTKLIEDKKLEFGSIDNMGDWFKLNTGLFVGEEEMNSSSFRSFIEKLRNDSLKLAKGIQTDADAERVMGELLNAIDQKDGKLVLQKLNDIKRTNTRSLDIRKKQIVNRRQNAKVGAFDFSTLGSDGTAPPVKYTITDEGK